VEEKLEEQEPGRKHLSGFYRQRGYGTMVGNRRYESIVLVSKRWLAGRVAGSHACLAAV